MPVQVKVTPTIRSTCTSSKTDSPSISHVTDLYRMKNNSHKDKKKNDENKLRKNFFPFKLMGIITSTLFEDCTTWDREGKSFAITDIEKIAARSNLSNGIFEKESFVRKLNRWGFRKKKNEGRAYYSHPLFHRDKPWLCEGMRCGESRAKVNTKIASKRHIDESKNESNNESNDDSLLNTNQTKKRKVTNFEDNMAKGGCRFDFSGQPTLIKVFSRYLADKCDADVDTVYMLLKKYLFLGQLRNEELTRIMCDISEEDMGEVCNENLEDVISVDCLHKMVINKATLALLSNYCFY